MDLTIKIDYKMADTITRKNLVDMYRTCEIEIRNLEEESEVRDLMDFEKVDLYDSQKHLKMLGNVLGYMSVKTDLEEFGLEDLANW